MASTSPVTVANVALAQLGREPILALTDESEPARMASLLYDRARELVLNSHQWNCATRRATLARLDDAPTHGYAYAYQLPADFLRVREVSTETGEWRIEGTSVVTDADAVDLTYVANLSDVSKMDRSLQHAIAMRLAQLMALRLTGSREIAGDCERQAQMAMSEARLYDAHAQSPETLQPLDLLEARLGAEDSPFRPIPTPDQ